MSPLLAELLGTAILIVLGDGVVANVVLQRTKGHNSGWIVITAGWAFGVTIAVYCVNSISGAHLNPAVTIALASIGAFDWARVPMYIAAQIAGGFLGGVIVWLAYLPHWKATPDPVSKPRCSQLRRRFPTVALFCRRLSGIRSGARLLAVSRRATSSPVPISRRSGRAIGVIGGHRLSLVAAGLRSIRADRDPACAAVLPKRQGSSDWAYA